MIQAASGGRFLITCCASGPTLKANSRQLTLILEASGTLSGAELINVRASQTAPMTPDERLAYSPISDRAPLKLPEGARMVVWTIVNVEEWDIHKAMPRTVLTPPAGGSPMPDIPNWAWHEYGNRVGFWRMLEVLDALRIRAVLAINGSAIGRYEAIGVSVLSQDSAR